MRRRLVSIGGEAGGGEKRATPEVQRLFPVGDGEVEEIRPLARGGAFALEHIVSHGQASPAGFWYDQPLEEWVMLVRGKAVLRFEEGEVAMEAGDAMLIPARCRHRVEVVSGDAHWIALHFEGRGEEGSVGPDKEVREE